MERARGFEPPTFSLGSCDGAVEPPLPEQHYGAGTSVVRAVVSSVGNTMRIAYPPVLSSHDLRRRTRGRCPWTGFRGMTASAADPVHKIRHPIWFVWAKPRRTQAILYAKALRAWLPRQDSNLRSSAYDRACRLQNLAARFRTSSIVRLPPLID